MNGNFTGREEECKRLERCLLEKQAQLIIVYGRRRVGKTYLINQFFDGRFDFKLTGAYEVPREEQLRHFSAELRRHTGEKTDAPRDWQEAFEQLRVYIASLPPEEKHVVFFDEMPWLDTQRSGFLSAFEWFWNDFGSACDQLVLIICGSATSWLAEKVDDNQGGLYNRQTCRIYLEPFSLLEVESYLQKRGIVWSRYEIALCYMIMGGIPYYLSLLDPERSLSENIDNLFFRKRAELWDEYDHLYRTLFRNSTQYFRVAEALSEKRYGMTREEISQKTGLAANGTLTKILKDLTDSGFVRREAFYPAKKKEAVYQLADYYSLFYFRFIKGGFGRDEHFWSHTVDYPSRRSWSGYTFEQLCKDHIRQIKRKLGISGVLTEESTWFIKSDEKEGVRGAQIDLLIDRRDFVVSLCEMKFSMSEYEIDKDEDRILRNKIDAFQRKTSCKKTIQPVLVTTYGLHRNKYSGLIGKVVLLDDLFERE